MSKNKKIYRPRKGADLPEAPVYDPDTMLPSNVDKKAALKQWFTDSKTDNINDDECYEGVIDPKQAFYVRKERKK